MSTRERDNKENEVGLKYLMTVFGIEFLFEGDYAL